MQCGTVTTVLKTINPSFWPHREAVLDVFFHPCPQLCRFGCLRVWINPKCLSCMDILTLENSPRSHGTRCLAEGRCGHTIVSLLDRNCCTHFWTDLGPWEHEAGLPGLLQNMETTIGPLCSKQGGLMALFLLSQYFKCYLNIHCVFITSHLP